MVTAEIEEGSRRLSERRVNSLDHLNGALGNQGSEEWVSDYVMENTYVPSPKIGYYEKYSDNVDYKGFVRAADTSADGSHTNHNANRCGSYVSLSQARLAKKLVYNRVSKTGSTSIQHILRRAHMRTQTKLVNPGRPYMPNSTYASKQLGELRANEIFVNHFHFLKPPNVTDSSLAWFNIVREPIARYSSQFYFHSQIAEKRAEENADKQCGCPLMEFDDCIRKMYKNGCDFHDRWRDQDSRQYTYFCEAPSSRGKHFCTAKQALENVHKHYAFVGLTEEFQITLKALEKLFPHFFPHSLDMGLHSNPMLANNSNPVPSERHLDLNSNKAMSRAGAISHVAVRMMSERLSYLKQEIQFYIGVKRLFYCRAGAWGLLDYTNPVQSPPRPHEPILSREKLNSTQQNILRQKFLQNTGNVKRIRIRRHRAPPSH